MVSHLCRFNRDNVNVEDYEETYIRKMFMSLSTDGDGFINLKDLVDGFEKDLMQFSSNMKLSLIKLKSVPKVKT